jgi:hypothetical protein
MVRTALLLVTALIALVTVALNVAPLSVALVAVTV